MAFDLTKPSMTDADWPVFAANIRENFRALVQDALTITGVKTFNSNIVFGSSAFINSKLGIGGTDTSVQLFATAGAALTYIKAGSSGAFHTGFYAQNTIRYWFFGVTATGIFTLENQGVVALSIDTNNKLAIGVGGTPIAKHLSETETWNPGLVAAGAVSSVAVTVTGAAVGDTIAFGFTPALATPASWRVWAELTAANTVTVLFENRSGAGITPASTTVRADVWQH